MAVSLRSLKAVPRDFLKAVLRWTEVTSGYIKAAHRWGSWDV